MQEADSPSPVQPCSELQPAEMVHGLDWPFVSELERAVWKARCLLQLHTAYLGRVEALAARCTEATQAVQRALSAAQPPLPAADHAALKQLLKRTSTTLQLDSGAAIALGQEAQQHLFPVLQHACLAEVE